MGFAGAEAGKVIEPTPPILRKASVGAQVWRELSTGGLPTIGALITSLRLLSVWYRIMLLRYKNRLRF